MSGYDDLGDRTADLLSLESVKRWSVIKTVRDQSVSEHCFGVAVIAMELADRLNVPSGAILRWALCHDAPETLTGDIDGKFKRENPAVREAISRAEERLFPWWARYKTMATADPVVYWLVKLADRIEAVVWVRVWGIGSRADDVFRENLSILLGSTVPQAAVEAGFTLEVLYDVVKHIIDHSVQEANSVQLRRFRSGSSQTPPAVHEP